MTYRVECVSWEGGWELRIEGEGVTQVDTLFDAESQVRDYLTTRNGGDFSDAEIELALHGLDLRPPT